MADLTLTVLGSAGDCPQTYSFDPADPSTLEVADAALAAFLGRGQTALVPGKGQIKRIDPQDVPAEILIVAPMFGG